MFTVLIVLFKFCCPVNRLLKVSPPAFPAEHSIHNVKVHTKNLWQLCCTFKWKIIHFFD